MPPNTPIQMHKLSTSCNQRKHEYDKFTENLTVTLRKTWLDECDVFWYDWLVEFIIEWWIWWLKRGWRWTRCRRNSSSAHLTWTIFYFNKFLCFDVKIEFVLLSTQKISKIWNFRDRWENVLEVFRSLRNERKQLDVKNLEKENFWEFCRQMFRFKNTGWSKWLDK